MSRSFPSASDPLALRCMNACCEICINGRQALRRDSPEALSIHARRALIGLHEGVGMSQHVFPVHLVEEQIETVAGRGYMNRGDGR